MSGSSWRERFAELGITIHPASDQFPEISGDELAELGNDIVENGLRHPVVLFCERNQTRPQRLSPARGTHTSRRPEQAHGNGESRDPPL